MSAVSLVLTLVLLVAGLAAFARTLWTKESYNSVVGLWLLNGSGVAAMVHAAVNSL